MNHILSTEQKLPRPAPRGRPGCCYAFYDNTERGRERERENKCPLRAARHNPLQYREKSGSSEKSTVSPYSSEKAEIRDLQAKCGATTAVAQHRSNLFCHLSSSHAPRQRTLRFGTEYTGNQLTAGIDCYLLRAPRPVPLLER